MIKSDMVLVQLYDTLSGVGSEIYFTSVHPWYEKKLFN